MGLVAPLSSIALLIRLRPIVNAKVNGGIWRTVTEQHWTYGRWLLVSSVLSWVTGDIYYPVISSFSGMAAAGALRALLNFVLPVAQMFTALSIFVLPYASRFQQENGNASLRPA